MIITIPGQPIPKGRPRVFRNRTITPKRTADYEKRVAAIAKKAWKGPPIPAGTAVAVVIDCYFVRPARLNRRKDDSFAIAKATRPDADNCAKSILDGLEKAGVWADDGQVTNLHIRKWYCSKALPEPKTIVRIEVQSE